MGQVTHSKVHEDTARRFAAEFARDPRILGVAAGGSWLKSMDDFSDLDLVVAVHPDHENAVRDERIEMAKRCGPLLAAFTGEHVGEPRLLICLYGPPLQHVDLKFVAVGDLDQRVEDPVILWERGDEVSRALKRGEARYPQPDPQWIEERFWTWIHYVAAKIGRGELFEAIDSVGFLRARVLGPLLLLRAGHRPSGVRRLEQWVPRDAERLKATVCSHDRSSCLAALSATIAIYRELREGHDVVRREAAERAACDYVDALGRTSPGADADSSHS
jgi:hypothetical protein